MSSSGSAIQRRKKKSKKDSFDQEQPTKEQKQVAKYLRFNMKTKDGICYGNEVCYFPGSRAVDMLMASKWAGADKRDDSVLFASRKACVDYCQNLLEKNMFSRVIRIRRQKKTKELKEKKKGKKKATENAEPPADANNNSAVAEASNNNESTATKISKPKKPRRPAKLEPHEDQVFIDGDADDIIYAWIFDPVSPKTYLIGGAVIIGAIAACLYPLWPMQLRLGVYYICLGLLGLLGLLLVLAVVRLFLFAGIWCCTFGKRHFWLYPNLFEDVGFFDSFRPLYLSTTASAETGKKSTKDKPDSKDDATEVEDAKTGGTGDSRTTGGVSRDQNEDNSGGEHSTGSSAGAQDFELLHHADFEQAPGRQKGDDDDKGTSSENNDDDDDDENCDAEQ